MDKVLVGATVYVYGMDGGYLGSGVYQGMVPIDDALEESGFCSELEVTEIEVLDVEITLVVMNGSNERIYMALNRISMSRQYSIDRYKPRK